MSDIATADTSTINLEKTTWGPSSTGYSYKFLVDEDVYRVSLSKDQGPLTGLNIGDDKILDIWTVSLGGPLGDRATNKVTGAHTVYKYLLLAIKKLMEIEKVNGFNFYHAEPAMSLVYNRFYKKFLANDFVRVSQENYVRKDVLRDFLKDKPPNARTNYYWDMIYGNRTLRKIRNTTEEKKAKQRNDRMKANRYFHKVAYVNHLGLKILVYVKAIYTGGPKLQVLVRDINNQEALITPDNILDEPVRPEEADQLKAKLTKMPFGWESL